MVVNGQETCRDTKANYKGSHCCGAPTKLVPFNVTGLEFDPLGSNTGLYAEASDAGNDTSLAVDGQSGDVDFPFMQMKTLASVGEVWENGQPYVGVPDGLGAYRKNQNQIRLLIQSESYGPITAYQSFGHLVNDNTLSISGSHLMYFDIAADKLQNFLNSSDPGSSVIEDFGEVIRSVRNCEGNLVEPPESWTAATAFDSATTIDGHWAILESSRQYKGNKQVHFQSFCAAYAYYKENWGPGYGAADDFYLTNEEWSYLNDDPKIRGLPAWAIEPYTGEAWAVAAFGMGGFEKISSMYIDSTKYIAFLPSGYNGAFGSSKPNIVAAKGNRSDGTPYVWPQDIVPSQIAIGKKNVGYDCMTADTSFLGRNGLKCVKVYGFATTNSEITADGLDAYMKTGAGATAGSTSTGKYLPTAWRFEGVMSSFIDDLAWKWQDPPVYEGDGDYHFVVSKTRDARGKKHEHLSAVPKAESTYLHSSTAGHIVMYKLTNGFTADATSASDEYGFPLAMDATMTSIQGEVTPNMVFGGKGITSAGVENRVMHDKKGGEYTTFEDIDGMQIVSASDGDYVVIQEDGGNVYGERMFWTKVDLQDPKELTWYWGAQAGGRKNTRMMAGVTIPSNSHGSPKESEFSGVWDLTLATTAGANNFERLQASLSLPIKEHLLAINLQMHGVTGGDVKHTLSDRGGQTYVAILDPPENN